MNYEDSETNYIYNEQKSKDRLIKRMVDSYKKRKRKKKIEKLMDRDDHWSGLS